MPGLLVEALPELIATLVGVAVGGTLAFTNENYRQRRHFDRQKYVILRTLARELTVNHDVINSVLPHFRNTPYGKSYFLNTSAWQTALATEELPNIVGFRLADIIGHHYNTLGRLQFYGELMVRVWLTHDDLEGYTEIQSGFRQIIVESLEHALDHYPKVMRAITDEIGEVDTEMRWPGSDA